MKANPGGEIDTDDIVGRDELVKDIWEILEVQSILLTAERRIGKTTILKKMRTKTPDKFICIYQDLEGYTTPEEFVHSVGSKLQNNFKWFNKAKHQGGGADRRECRSHSVLYSPPDS